MTQVPHRGLGVSQQVQIGLHQTLQSRQGVWSQVFAVMQELCYAAERANDTGRALRRYTHALPHFLQSVSDVNVLRAGRVKQKGHGHWEFLHEQAGVSGHGGANHVLQGLLAGVSCGFCEPGPHSIMPPVRYIDNKFVHSHAVRDTLHPRPIPAPGNACSHTVYFLFVRPHITNRY